MANQFEYHVDLVFVIDATASMTPVLEHVKAAALGFHSRLAGVLEQSGKHVDKLRIRVVTFRDLPDNRDQALGTSPFFTLPAQEAPFASYIQAIELAGNTTFPESGLAGLAVAMHSPWTKEGAKRRHVVVLWTDDEPHPPENEVAFIPTEFRGEVCESLDELTDVWESAQYAALSSRRLVLFAPEKGLWSVINQSWDNVIMYPSQAGSGVSEYDLAQIVSAIANSI